MHSLVIREDVVEGDYVGMFRQVGHDVQFPLHIVHILMGELGPQDGLACEVLPRLLVRAQKFTGRRVSTQQPMQGRTASLVAASRAAAKARRTGLGRMRSRKCGRRMGERPIYGAEH